MNRTHGPDCSIAGITAPVQQNLQCPMRHRPRPLHRTVGVVAFPPPFYIPAATTAHEPRRTADGDGTTHQATGTTTQSFFRWLITLCGGGFTSRSGGYKLLICRGGFQTVCTNRFVGTATVPAAPTNLFVGVATIPTAPIVYFSANKNSNYQHVLPKSSRNE